MKALFWGSSVLLRGPHGLYYTKQWKDILNHCKSTSFTIIRDCQNNQKVTKLLCALKFLVSLTKIDSSCA